MTKLSDLKPVQRLFLGALQGGVILLLLGFILFLSAGTFNWLNGWLLLGTYALCFMLTTSILFLRVPELMDVRREKHANVKLWDRYLVLAYQTMYFPIFIMAGLDKRYVWSKLPLVITIIGIIFIIVFFALATWAPLVNQHLETHIRIQNDRDHQVIDHGPYAIVRHPTYIGLALFFIGVPLALGSLWALVPGFIGASLVFLRTNLEDKILQNELAGYREYTQRVRYRWIPLIW